MKKIMIMASLILAFSMQAQDKKEDAKVWKKGGTLGLTFSQASFSNWLKGGENALAVNALVNYDFNYKKDKSVWDTKVIGAYGLSRIANDTKKTDDRFEINSVYGMQAKGNWYYSFFGDFKTQFTDGFDYSVTPSFVTSKLLAPAYFNFGPGMLWKKSDNLKVNFAPATSKLLLVMDDDLSAAGAYGVDHGKNLRYELGMAVNAYYKFDLMKNISVENILGLYSNYLDQPENVDLDYQMNIAMAINKYFSANIGLHTIYDDNALQDIQFKEIFGLGFNAKF